MRNTVRETGWAIWCGVAILSLPLQAAELDEAVIKLLEADEGMTRSEPSSPQPKSRAPVTNSRDTTAGTSLTLAEAERMAQDNDPVSKSLREKAGALVEQSAAAERLADPKIKFGISEYPTRTPSSSGEDPIKMLVGVQQTIMPSARREHESAQLHLMGQGQSARAAQQKLLALRETRKAWLDIYLQHHTLVVLRQTRKILAQLVEISQSQYRAGSGNQSDVLQAQIELSLLKDQASQVETAREIAVAELTRWAGPGVANRTLAMDSLELPVVPELARIEQGLDRLPLLQGMKLDADAAKEGVEVARARATPEWMWEVETMWSYSKDGKFGTDSLAAFVTLDVPFARKNLQDRWLAGSEKDYNSTLFLVADQRRDLKRMLDLEVVNTKRLDERIAFYREAILPQAAQNAQAALRAYQAQVADFSQLMRARQKELESKLAALRLLVERAMVQVNLLYLSGDGV